MEKKGNVALITIYHVPNYGSVLQAFATQCLIEKLGFDCTILNYKYPNEWHIIQDPKRKGSIKSKIITNDRVLITKNSEIHYKYNIVSENESYKIKVNNEIIYKKLYLKNNTDGDQNKIHEILNEYIKNKKYWNIEYYFIPEFKFFGNAKFENYTIPEEIEMINDDKDFNIFSKSFHVKRYPHCNYYAYINDNIVYELGETIDAHEFPFKEYFDLTIGGEYYDGKNLRKFDEVTQRFTIDTVFPSYPKLTKDLESIMIEPFKIDVLREYDDNALNNYEINYSAELNNEECTQLNSEDASKKYIMDKDGNFENGEFLLDTFAKKESTEAFRFRSSYFTINSFQHVPLKPLKTKIIPLKFDKLDESIAREGELVLNSNTGHYGIADSKGNINSPTLYLSSELVAVEENSNDISKMYLKSKNELEMLIGRYENNCIRMRNLFTGKNSDIVKLNILVDSIKEISQELDIVNETNGKNKDSLFVIVNTLSDLKNEIKNFKEELKNDYEEALKIMHEFTEGYDAEQDKGVPLLNTLSLLRTAIRDHADLKEYINNILLSKDFERYMAYQEEIFELWREAVRNEYINTRG